MTMSNQMPLIDPFNLTVEDQLQEMNLTSNPDEKIEVVTLVVQDIEWHIKVEDWEKAQEEGRTFPVIFKDELRLVDKETFGEFQKLMKWMNDEKNLGNGKN